MKTLKPPAPGPAPARAGVDAGLVARVWEHLRARDERPRPDGAPDRPRLQAQIRAEDDGESVTDLLVYDEIGYWGVTAGDVVEALAGINGPIHVRINSPGGDVFDGVAIYNALRAHPAAVTVSVDGLAASAASFIAMAGSRITAQRASQMMIHDASGMCYGNASDMGEMADLLDRVSDMIAGIYADRTGTTSEEWRNRMRAETWYSAAEAVTAGLADETPPAPGKDDDGQDGDDAEGEDEQDGKGDGDKPWKKQATDEEDGEIEASATARYWDVASIFRFKGRNAAPDPAPDALPEDPNDASPGDGTEPAADPWEAATAHLTTPEDDPFLALTEALQ